MEADQEYIMQTISNLEYEMETEIPTNTTRQHDTMINVLNLILLLELFLPNINYTNHIFVFTTLIIIFPWFLRYP